MARTKQTRRKRKNDSEPQQDAQGPKPKLSKRFKRRIRKNKQQVQVPPLEAGCLKTVDGEGLQNNSNQDTVNEPPAENIVSKDNEKVSIQHGAEPSDNHTKLDVDKDQVPHENTNDSVDSTELLDKDSTNKSTGTST